MICWSGGSRGSGLYIVASQGGSPSGRLMAVLGLSGLPDLVTGLAAGDEFAPPVLVESEAFRAVGVALRVPFVIGVLVGLFAVLDLVGDA